MFKSYNMQWSILEVNIKHKIDKTKELKSHTHTFVFSTLTCARVVLGCVKISYSCTGHSKLKFLLFELTFYISSL